MDSQATKGQLWTGYILMVLITLPFLMGIFMRLSGNPQVAEGMAHMGMPMDILNKVLALEILSLVLYLIPATSVVGAILLTGYMGGTIITHMRVHENVVMQTVIPILAWVSLFLREPRLRSLIPIRK